MDNFSISLGIVLYGFSLLYGFKGYKLLKRKGGFKSESLGGQRSEFLFAVIESCRDFHKDLGCLFACFYPILAYYIVSFSLHWFFGVPR